MCVPNTIGCRDTRTCQVVSDGKSGLNESETVVSGMGSTKHAPDDMGWDIFKPGDDKPSSKQKPTVGWELFAGADATATSGKTPRTAR